MNILTRAMARSVPRVRLVGEGSNEIVSIDVALRAADEAGLDLVIVSDQSDPPVVRIQDFKKLEYERKKATKKHGATSELKEIQLKVNISDHDLGTKISAAKRFLERGDKVKLTVRLKGRERESPERARAIIAKVAAQVECKVSSVPGPITIAILEPLKAPGEKDAPAAKPKVASGLTKSTGAPPGAKPASAVAAAGRDAPPKPVTSAPASPGAAAPASQPTAAAKPVAPAPSASKPATNVGPAKPATAKA